MTWIQTATGNRFDILSPIPELINIREIAVSLARKCRFGGHTKTPARYYYSVAQHSVFVCDLVDDPRLKMPALLHDAHEAYSGFGDVLSPAMQLDGYVAEFIKSVTRRIDGAIAERFGFDESLFYCDEIKHADLVALATEKRDLMFDGRHEWPPMPRPHTGPIKSMGIIESERLFLTRFRELTTN